MTRLPLLVLLLVPGIAPAQSPFDGTWLIDSESFHPPEEAAEFLLAGGTLRCSGCLANVSIKADGRDHGIPESAYWNTASVRSVDANTVEITTKKNGKNFYTETDIVSDDGKELTQLVRDTTETEAVTTTVHFRRTGKGPAGSHNISGRWRAFKVEKSLNSRIIKYKCTPEGFSAVTPLGEKYDAKFDGKFVVTDDDPGQTMVAVKRTDERTVETTIKRGEQIVGGSRLTVSPDGQTLYFVNHDANGKQTASGVMHKQPN